MASTSTLDELETTVARMAKISRCMSPSFSPDASRIAFVSDLNGIRYRGRLAGTGDRS